MQNLLHAQVNTWQRSHGTSKDDHCNNVIVAQDGNYIACGYSYGTDSLGTADFHMIKVDSTNGDLLWTWSEGNGGQETITTIEETKTGALLVAGNTSPVQLYLSSDVMLCKVSANGNLIWKQTYQLPDSQFCNDIAILPDGNICLVGLNRTAAGDSSGFFMKVDATGNLIDFKLYDIIGSEYFSGIVFTKDSMLAVNGTSIQPFPASNKIWMLKFDWNGDTIFTKLNTFYKYYTGVPLVQNINGNFILNVRELNTWSWVHILLYDSNFNLLDDLNWANYYSSPLCISVSGINEKFTVGRSDSYGLMIEHYKDTGAIEDLMSYNQVFRPSKFYGGGIDFALSTKYYAINNSKEGIVVAGSTTFNLNNSFDFCLVKYSDSLKLNFNTLTPTPNFVTDTICESDSILLYVMLNDKLNNIWLINDDTIYGLGDSIYAKHSGSYTPIGFDIEQNFIAGTSARVVVLDTSIVGSMYISINKPYCKYDGDTAIIIAPLNSKATYQWQLNGVNIPGATSNQVKANGTGNYQCVYNFGCATKVSNVVYINDSAAITVSLNTSTGIYRSYCSGSKMDPSLLIMQASNNVTYNWYNNGNLVNTGTNLPTIKENDSIWYVVSVNGCGIDTSLFAYYIDEPLQQTTACNYVGDTIEFCNNDSVEFCSGSTNWKRNGTTIPNVTLPFYATLAGSYQYYYQTGNCGAWSIPIFIVDNLPDSINFNTYPNDTVCTSKVSIYALPYNNLSTYSWYYKGNYLNDTASITADSTGWYRCVVHSPNCLQQIVDSIYIVKLGSAAKCIAQDSMYNTCTDSVIIKDASPDSNANYVW
ncbi:MAG: hypothetical protein IPO27_02070 [Bacteroidetes bacterium]|nr:hypothetical protein [Bacteroidota bacterium]